MGSLPLSCQLLMKNMANIFLLSGPRSWTSKLIISKQRHSRPSCCRILLLCPCPCPCPCPFPCHPWPCPCPCHSHHHRHSHHHSPCHTLRRLRRSHQPLPQRPSPVHRSPSPDRLRRPNPYHSRPSPWLVQKWAEKQRISEILKRQTRKTEELDVTMISVEFVSVTFL